MSNPPNPQSRVHHGHGYAYLPRAMVVDDCARLMVRESTISARLTKRPPVTVDMLQNKKIAGLQQELADMRKLMDMVLTLVDPEDVRAAFELKRITPSHAELTALAAQCQPPEDLCNLDEEKPW